MRIDDVAGRVCQALGSGHARLRLGGTVSAGSADGGSGPAGGRGGAPGRIARAGVATNG